VLDALVDYQIEVDDPTREVPNPAWGALLSGGRDRHDGKTDRNSESKDYSSYDDRN